MMRVATLLAVILAAGAAGTSGCAQFGGVKSDDQAAASAPDRSLATLLFGAGASSKPAEPAPESQPAPPPAPASRGMFAMFGSSRATPPAAAPPAAPAPAPQTPPAPSLAIPLIAPAPSGVQLAAVAAPTQEELLARLKGRHDVDAGEYARWEKIVNETPQDDWPLVALQLQAVLNYKSYQAAQEARNPGPAVRGQEVAEPEPPAAAEPAAPPPVTPPEKNPDPPPPEPAKEAQPAAAPPAAETPAAAPSAPPAKEEKPAVLPPPEKDEPPPQPLASASTQAGPAAEKTAQDKPANEKPANDNPASAGVATGPWRESLNRAIAALEAELQQMPTTDVAAAPSAPASEAEFRSQAARQRDRAQKEAQLRLLYLVAQRNADAVRGVEAFPPAEQEFWKHQVHGLSVFLDEQGAPVPDRRARLALRELREGLHHLAVASGLDVRNLAFCPQVFSFGNYVEFTPYEFRPNQEVLLYAEIDNFAVESRPDGFETELQGSYQIFDGAGRRVAEHVFPPEKEVCRNRRRDYFIPFRLYLPKRIPPGPYTLQLTVEDLKGRQFGQAPIRFTIVP